MGLAAMTDDYAADVSWQDRLRSALALRPAVRDVKTLVDLANGQGISLSLFGTWEMMRGKQEPTSNLIAAIVVVLEMHPAQLGIPRYDRTEVGFLLADERLGPYWGEGSAH